MADPPSFVDGSRRALLRGGTGDCRSIGGVSRCGWTLKLESQLNHFLDLSFGRRSVPGDRRLDLRRGVDGDFEARRAAEASTTPLAWPTLIAVRTLAWKKTRSTATADGWKSSIRASISPCSAPRRQARSSVAGVRMTPRRHDVARSRTRARQNRITTPGQAGIDAENPARLIEHAYDSTPLPDRGGFIACCGAPRRVGRPTGTSTRRVRDGRSERRPGRR